MSGKDVPRVFFDTNVLLYALADTEERTTRALDLLLKGGYVSVQVLNEFVNVSRRKFKKSWEDVDDFIRAVRALCGPVQPISEEVHEEAVRIAKSYQLGIYDANIVAAALLAGCTTLYSEDMQDGQKIGGLTLRNPFKAVSL